MKGELDKKYEEDKRNIITKGQRVFSTEEWEYVFFLNNFRAGICPKFLCFCHIKPLIHANLLVLLGLAFI